MSVVFIYLAGYQCRLDIRWGSEKRMGKTKAKAREPFLWACQSLSKSVFDSDFEPFDHF
jgi:hypothetical protein